MNEGPDKWAFNTPAAAIRRMAYLACILGVAFAPVALLIGVMAGRREMGFLGLFVLFVAGICRAWLHQRGTFDAVASELDEMTGSVNMAASSTKVAELVELLLRWDALERQRGSPEFDPWAVQSLRREIREVIEANPSLENLFSG
jgi:hypothetical protein